MSLKPSRSVKMINKEVDGEQARDPRLAALLAVHLVSEVLEEASLIANAARDVGTPLYPYKSILKYLEMEKKSDADDEDTSFEASKGDSDIVKEEASLIANATRDVGTPLYPYKSILKYLEMEKKSAADDENTSFEASKGDSDIVNENKMAHVANVVATSTPEKVTDDLQKNKLETSFIGQGDEEHDSRQNELTKSTSMFINHLFDMSDVERVTNCDDSEIVQSSPEPNERLVEATIQILESFVNTAMGMTTEQTSQAESSQSEAAAVPSEKSSNSENSEYSFLTDAYDKDIGKDIAFYIHDDGAGDIDRDNEVSHVVPAVKIGEPSDEIPEKLVESMDVTRYENAYLTLNRDYDQNSEDEGYPILEDPKGMTLQEVELMTAHTSDENLSTHAEPEPIICPKMKELAATSGVSADPSGSKKSSLVSKCRSQGARLLACIRGWWRRRTPGKRKENRIPFAARGLCPLSPDARRRAASLLDQRLIRSPSPNRGAVWKFNTVNEALVHSSRWKDYTFDVKPEECGEY